MARQTFSKAHTERNIEIDIYMYILYVYYVLYYIYILYILPFKVYNDDEWCQQQSHVVHSKGNLLILYVFGLAKKIRKPPNSMCV